MITKERLKYLVENPEEMEEEEAEIIHDLHEVVTEALNKISTWVEAVSKAMEEEEENKMNISEMVKLAHQNAKQKGFWDEPREVGTMLALIHSEVSEALEAHRYNDTEGFKEELAELFPSPVL